MNVDAGGTVDQHPGPAQLPHKLLYRFDIPISADGADHLHAVVVVGGNNLTAAFPLCFDAAVAHEFPLASLTVQSGIDTVIGAVEMDGRTEMLGGHLRGLLPGEAGHFHLNAKALILHVQLLFHLLSAIKWHKNTACFFKQTVLKTEWLISFSRGSRPRSPIHQGSAFHEG